MIYQGSCHCGKVAFEVEGEISGVISCNCSICQRKGALMWFVARDKLNVRAEQASLGNYTFNKHVIQHRFCLNCGMHPYGEGVDPAGNAMAAINLRCLENIDLEAIPVQPFDGRSK